MNPDTINGAAGLASRQASSLRINCLSSLRLAFLKELKDELGYKSSLWEAQDEMKSSTMVLMIAFDG